MRLAKVLFLPLFLLPAASWAGPTKVISGTVSGYDRDTIKVKTTAGRVEILTANIQPLLAERLVQSLDKKVVVEVPVASINPRPTYAPIKTKSRKR